MFNCLVKGPAAVAKHRSGVLAHWARRRDQLADREAQLHKALGPGVAKVLAGRNLLLLREMLESTGYPDRALVGDIVSGFMTTGDLPPTGAFPPKEGPATRTVRGVLAEARRAQRFVFAEGRGCGGGIRR